MKALLDTNIVIHREANTVINEDIGALFRWLDKAKYKKCIHPITIYEVSKNLNLYTVNTIKTKLESYERLRTIAPMAHEVKAVSEAVDTRENDRNDSLLLNEVFCERVDILISEDKQIHRKAEMLGISERVFTIDSFLEKVVAENPELINYKVLSVTQKYFGEISLNDPFFDSFKEDYAGFGRWFSKKSDENAYVTYNMGKILSFLYVKVEEKDENYSDITPALPPKRRLKIGTFKVLSNGVKLGERFLKIVFDNALQYKVEEIYVTIFEKRPEQIRLVNLLIDWGFFKHGTKSTSDGEESVYIRSFLPSVNIKNPRLTYPFFSSQVDVFLVPIYPKYHTELLPDSFLRTESPLDFIENEPHRNAISKVYLSRSFERSVKRGDLLIFYRTAEQSKPAYYSSVITTIAIVEDKIDNITNVKDFIIKCRKRSVFSDSQLQEQWNWSTQFRPFIINFLYVYPFALGNRLNRKRLLDLSIIDGSDDELRGLKRIDRTRLLIILKETKTNESLIVN